MRKIVDDPNTFAHKSYTARGCESWTFMPRAQGKRNGKGATTRHRKSPSVTYRCCGVCLVQGNEESTDEGKNNLFHLISVLGEGGFDGGRALVFIHALRMYLGLSVDAYFKSYTRCD